MSGLMPSYSQASILPVLQSPCRDKVRPERVRSLHRTYCLDFVTDKEHVVFLAKIGDALQVSLRWHHDTIGESANPTFFASYPDAPSLSLDGLRQESSYVLPVHSKRALNVFENAISDDLWLAFFVYIDGPHTLEVWAEATSTLRIRAHAKSKIRHYIDFISDLHASSSPDDAQGSPMEVALHAEHYGLPFFNPFAHVRPLSGELDGGLDGLSAGIHGQHHFISKEGGDLLGKLPEYRIVECSG